MSKHEEKMGLLPIMNPLYNLREICKQVALLEEHLNQPRKRCPDCIRKHFLTIEALFEEAISLDKQNKYGEHLDGKAQDIRDLQGAWIDSKDTDQAHDVHLMIAQALRQLRKGFAPLCFDVRKMASRVAHQYMKVATKTQSEKEDDAAQKLIRKAPKKKPPRKDLRKNRVEMVDDPDLKGVGRGDDGDPDLSRRSQKMAQMIRNVVRTYCRLQG